MNAAVERDEHGLFVELEGIRFTGEDLPPEGTWILSASTWRHVGGYRAADVEWSGETPSGRCCAQLRER